VKARILRNGQWSALTEATFVVPNADFDANNVVNGFDFLLWQRGFGTTDATPADGDADLDGDVDGEDLAAVEQQFGLGAPEPVVTAITSPFSEQEKEPDPERSAASPLLAASVSPTSPEMVPSSVRSNMLSAARNANAASTIAKDTDLDSSARRRDASQSLRRSSLSDQARSADDMRGDDAAEKAFEDWSKLSRFQLRYFAIRSSS
jgi:hypothetical protein